MLRQLLISMALVCACVGNAFAQGAFAPKKHDHQGEHKHEGRFFVGGAINYWYDTEDKSQSLSFAPEVGYLFNDTWGRGDLHWVRTSIRISPIIHCYSWGTHQYPKPNSLCPLLLFPPPSVQSLLRWLRRLEYVPYLCK